MLAASGSMFFASAATASPNPGNKITICHGTNSNNNPYVVNSPNANGNVSGHAGHTGPVWNPTLKAQHIAWGDIIPPFDYNDSNGVQQHFPGLNWTAAGQAIWNNGCNIPAPALSISKSQTSPNGNVAPGGAVTYSVTITNNGGPTTGATTVTDNLPAEEDPGTMVYASGAASWTCANTTAGTASQNPSCSTTDSLASGASTTFTVSTTVKSTTGAGTYTNTATVKSDDGTHSATAPTTVAVPGGPGAPANLAISGACTPGVAGQVTWTVTNPAGNGPLTNLVITSTNPGGVVVTGPASNTVTDGGSTTFTTAAPLSPAGSLMHAAGTANGQPVGSNAPGFAGSCAAGQVETPALVDFASDCAGIQATFTSASLHTTTFTVTPPVGGVDTVLGSSSKHYVADTNNKHISVNFDGTSASGDWVDPGNCSTSSPQADPQLSEANHCKSGMSLTLSNMNGTADTTFTVTDPDGKTQQVGVRAGQLKKLFFAVKEDTTGTLSVSAPGLAKKTYTYKKNCATVLGVKHTRKPPHKPVVKGEHAQLPFTGFDTRRALLDGAALFFFGAVLCMLGARRKDEDYVY